MLGNAMSGKRRILVVDDNEDFCDNIADLLEVIGYEAVCAHDAERAITLIEKEHFGLLNQSSGNSCSLIFSSGKVTYGTMG